MLKTFHEKGLIEAGCDEAGRGSLAGPVVAVSLNWGDAPLIEGVKDSKKISDIRKKIQKPLLKDNFIIFYLI